MLEKILVVILYDNNEIRIVNAESLNDYEHTTIDLICDKFGYYFNKTDGTITGDSFRLYDLLVNLSCEYTILIK